METDSLLQDLDFAVEMVCCEVCDAPAANRVVFHQCNAELVCARHGEFFLQALGIDMEAKGKKGIECQSCKKAFWVVEEWVWLEPL